MLSEVTVKPSFVKDQLKILLDTRLIDIMHRKDTHSYSSLVNCNSINIYLELLPLPLSQMNQVESQNFTMEPW